MKNCLVWMVVLMSASLSAQSITNFTGTNIVTGQSVSLNDYKSNPGVVIIFTSTGVDCPYDNYYAGRLQTIARDYGKKLPVVFVNSHPGEMSSEGALKANAAKLGGPYLTDRDQTIMQTLRATKSPEAIVLKSAGGNFSVFYRGAIDDNAQVQTDVDKNYLGDAINALINGQQPESKEVRPVGCTIRKK